jgi:hypothetical protein
MQMELVDPERAPVERATREPRQRLALHSEEMNMRPQSPEHRGCNEGKPTIAAGMIKAALVLCTIGLGAGTGISPSAAQATDVAYVEAVSGRVVAFARGIPALVDTLDVIGDQTRLDLLANSELSVCHYRTQRFVTLKGPARVTISADGVTAGAGKAVYASAETCAAPALPKLQGGLLTRGK